MTPQRILEHKLQRHVQRHEHSKLIATAILSLAFAFWKLQMQHVMVAVAISPFAALL